MKLSQSAINNAKISVMSNMTSRLSHDLRNPLTVIKGNLDLMMNRREVMVLITEHGYLYMKELKILLLK